MGKYAPAAFTMLPLAVIACMANPALADTITLNSPTCGPSNTGGAGTCSATVTNGGVSTLGATLTSSFTSVPILAVTDLVLFASANANGQLFTPQTFTLTYDFNVNRISLGGDSLAYTVSFSAADSSCPTKGLCSSSVSGVIPTGTGNYEVSGVDTLVLPAGTITAENYALVLEDLTSNKSSYSLTSASFLATNGAAATPEPASLLLAGTGMALVALMRRRNKAA